TLNYDSYLSLTDIGLPSGGTIHYDWETISLIPCEDSTTVSRAVSTRTVTDNNGNSFVWHYHWGVASGGVLINRVTDPNQNDTVHTFTTQDGSSGCTFYETKTQNYQGGSVSGELLEQVDTTYSAPTLFADSVGGNGGFGNIFPVSIKTTVKPNSTNKVR